MTEQNGHEGYGETLISILEEAIKSEIESEMKYLHTADLACDTCVRDFLRSLAKMEHEHADLLARELDELRGKMKVVDEMNQMFE